MISDQERGGPPIAAVELHSFDGAESARGRLARPDRYRHLFRVLSSTTPVIPRGSGLSRCLASAGSGCTSVSTRAFDRILFFDAASGLIVVEAGMRIGDLQRFAVDRGWYLHAVPGHPEITIGGCIAFDVHSPFHDDGGTFRGQVDSLRLARPGRGELHCDRTTEAPLFELTNGGLGLTGFVTDATLRLRALVGRSVSFATMPVESLAAVPSLLREVREHGGDACSVHDLRRGGDGFGRGVVVERRFADEPPRTPSQTTSGASERRRGSHIVRRIVERLGRGTESSTDRVDPAVASFRFPPDGVAAPSRQARPAGFREYQALVPLAAWPELTRELEQASSELGWPITRAEARLFSGRSGLLRFDGSGVAISLHLASGGELAILDRLDSVVLTCRGSVNLAKDSRVSAATVGALFPDRDRFASGLEAADPERRFDSALRRRILG